MLPVTLGARAGVFGFPLLFCKPNSTLPVGGIVLLYDKGRMR